MKGVVIMNTFMNEDFLLSNEIARHLYHNTSKDMPIIDYHNHLNPEEIAFDKTFKDITEVWLAHDHYKWRAMRANGISEKDITGDASSYDKFLAWAETVPKLLGNPLYHWTHLELQRYFGIHTLLDKHTAPDIWDEVNSQLQTPQKSVRSILKQDRVEFVGTTDDPADTLEFHTLIQKSNFDVQVSPSFRPDQALKIESDEFFNWLSKMEKTVDTIINSYDDLIFALQNRIDYFDQHGCKSSDHGINVMYYERVTDKEVRDIFKKRMKKEILTNKELNQFKTHLLVSLGEMYADKNWAMQLHIGPLRNNNSKMFNKLGADSGFDSMDDQSLAEPLSKF